MHTSKIESQIRNGDYSNLKKLSRSERMSFIREISVWNAARANQIALVIVGGFDEANHKGIFGR